MGVKISNLPAVVTPAMSDIFPIVQAGVTYKESVTQLAALLASSAGAPLTSTDDANVTITLGGSPATALLNAASLTMGWTGFLSVARGGTGVGAVNTVPAATTWAGWDAQANFSAVNFLRGFSTTATAAGTTVLTVASNGTQEFTGATTQTVTLPVVSTLAAGTQYYIINNSSGVVTVQSSGANTIQAMAAGTSLLVTCILTSGTGTASWQASYITDAGGTVNTGTANQTAYYAAAGNAVSGVGPGSTGQLYQSQGAGSAPAFTTATYPSTTTVSQLLYSSSSNVVDGLATANNGLLVTSNTGVPSILAGPGTTGQILQSNAAAAPSFSTASYPSTNTLAGTILRGDGTNYLQSSFTIPDTFAANDLIYCSTTNNLTALSSANNVFLTTNGSGVPSLSKTYLEGTFTPTLVSSGGGAPTYTLQQGLYTQMGNRIYFSINLVLATTGTLGAGTLTIAGLPTAAAASVALSTAFQSLAVGAITATAAVTSNASTSITVYKFASGSLTQLADTDLQGTSQFLISGNYNV